MRRTFAGSRLSGGELGSAIKKVGLVERCAVLCFRVLPCSAISYSSTEQSCQMHHSNFGEHSKITIITDALFDVWEAV